MLSVNNRCYTVPSNIHSLLHCQLQEIQDGNLRRPEAAAGWAGLLGHNLETLEFMTTEANVKSYLSVSYFFTVTIFAKFLKGRLDYMSTPMSNNKNKTGHFITQKAKRLERIKN